MDINDVDDGGVFAGIRRVIGLVDGQGEAGEADGLIHGISVADDDGAAGGVDAGVGEGLDDDLGADAARVSHGDGDGGFFGVRHGGGSVGEEIAWLTVTPGN